MKKFESFNFKKRGPTGSVIPSLGQEPGNLSPVERLFLDLTRITMPNGYENIVEKFLPAGWKRDSFNNYYYKIGESETMFTSHLDTADYGKPTTVKHIFRENEGQIFVGTFGNYILGADDKAGVAIMIKMIEKKVPGLYYFFIGEERGCKGSRPLNSSIRNGEDKDNPLYKNIKRVISFDRKGYGSIISHQCGDRCCSEDFVNDLSEKLGKLGLKFGDDPGGSYTDSYSFIYTFPECTNLSVGYFNQHSSKEIQNLTYLKWLAEAFVKLDWESLVTAREPKEPEPEPIKPRKEKKSIHIIDLRNLYIRIPDEDKTVEYAKILKNCGYKVFDYDKFISGDFTIDYSKKNNFFVYSQRKNCFYTTRLSLTQRQYRSVVVDLATMSNNPNVDIRSDEIRKNDKNKMNLICFDVNTSNNLPCYILQSDSSESMILWKDFKIDYQSTVEYITLTLNELSDDDFIIYRKNEDWEYYRKIDLPNEIKNVLKE